jgi:hypothetical protein
VLPPRHAGRSPEFVRGGSGTLAGRWEGQERAGVTRLLRSVALKGKGTLPEAAHPWIPRRAGWVDLCAEAVWS